MTVSKERWHALSLADQLGNIGSEVGRARTWQGKDEKSFWGAVSRALELLDLTQADPRWKARRHEINRMRESFADAVLGGKEYGSTLQDLENYCMPLLFKTSPIFVGYITLNSKELLACFFSYRNVFNCLEERF